MAKKNRWRPFRITHRTSGQWALFSMWLCVLFTISYGQEVLTKSTGMAHIMMAGTTKTVAATAFSQVHAEVGLYASHASILSLSLLILAVFKPRHRFAMMGVSVGATVAIATGLLEKLVSNNRLLSGEQVGVVTLGLDTSWLFSLVAIIDLGWMLKLDLAIILLSSLWAIISWRIAAGRVAALHRSAGSA